MVPAMTPGIGAFAVVFAATFLSSLLTAVVALGGGLILLGVLMAVLDFALVFPFMGAIQVSSGASRLWLFRRHVNFRLMTGFAAAFLPAAFIGGFVWAYVVANEAAQPWLKMVIGLYLALYLVFERLVIRPGNPARLLTLAGALCGFGAMTIGAVGPIFAPFVSALKLNKEAAVALVAIVTTLTNGARIPLLWFIADRLAWGHAVLLALLIAAAFAGTWTGRHILGQVSDASFQRLFKVVLAVLAAKLVFWDGARVIWG